VSPVHSPVVPVVRVLEPPIRAPSIGSRVDAPPALPSCATPSGLARAAGAGRWGACPQAAGRAEFYLRRLRLGDRAWSGLHLRTGAGTGGLLTSFPPLASRPRWRSPWPISSSVPRHEGSSSTPLADCPRPTFSGSSKRPRSGSRCSLPSSLRSWRVPLCAGKQLPQRRSTHSSHKALPSRSANPPREGPGAVQSCETGAGPQGGSQDALQDRGDAPRGRSRRPERQPRNPGGRSGRPERHPRTLRRCPRRPERHRKTPPGGPGRPERHLGTLQGVSRVSFPAAARG
jgi:hypothetical protein